MLVSLALSVLPGRVPSAQGQAPTDERVLARVYFSSQDELADLSGRIDIWEVHREDAVRSGQGWLLAYLDFTGLAWLEEAGYRVVIDEEITAQVNAPRVTLESQLNGIPGYSCYRTVNETLTTLDGWQAVYPNLVRLVDIGDSYDKVAPEGDRGYDLMVAVLTNELRAVSKPKLFIMASVHGREYSTAETAVRFGETLLQRYGVDAEVTWLLDYNEVHILAQANPDGRDKAQDGLYWRKNTHPYGYPNGPCSSTTYGVDLNRNSSFRWGGNGSSPYECNEFYKGPSDVSEPETAAIQSYVASLFPDRRGPGDNDSAPSDYEGLFITLHSYGNMVLWPWGDTHVEPPNSDELGNLGRKFAYFNHYAAYQSIGLYPTSGTNDDWAYGALGVPAYTFELGNAFFESCSHYESETWPANLPALIYALKAARRPYYNPAGPDTTSLTLSQARVPRGAPVTLTARADNTRYSSGPTSTAILAAHYSLDTPTWQDGVETHSLSAQDGAYNTNLENLTGTIDTSALAVGRHTVFVESQDASGYWGVSGAIFLTVDPPYSVSLVSVPAVKFGDPGDLVQHAVTVRNTGYYADTYSLTSSGNGWATSLLPGAISLAPGQSQVVTVSVQIPTVESGIDRVTLRAVSQADPSAAVELVLTTAILYGQLWLPVVHH